MNLKQRINISETKGRDIYLIKNIEFKFKKETLLKQKGTLLHEVQQGKHIIGHNNYKNESGISIVTLSTNLVLQFTLYQQ